MIFRHTEVFTDLVLRQPRYRVQTGREVCELIMEGKDLEGQHSVANTELHTRARWHCSWRIVKSLNT